MIPQCLDGPQRLGDHTGGAGGAHGVDHHLNVLEHPVRVSAAVDAHRGLVGADDPRPAQPREDRRDLIVETGPGTLQHRIQRAVADLQSIQVQEQPGRARPDQGVFFWTWLRWSRFLSRYPKFDLAR
jgi:hypothetical protein